MENDHFDEMDIEVLHSMWPEDIGDDVGKQFNVEKPGGDQDMLEEITVVEGPTFADLKRLLELTEYTDQGSSQLAYLVKHWEYQQANAVRLLREELDILSQQRQEVELKELEILEEHRFEEESYGGLKRPVSILDEVLETWHEVPRRKNDVFVQSERVEIDAECDSIVYWKQRAMHLEKLLEASVHREHVLMEKLQESIKHLEKESSPVEELSQILSRADNFLHFVLRNAPVVIGHQDKDLRYRFIYNKFPSLHEEDILGKTDLEIFSGSGVKESQDFKREVLEKGLPAKREITFETELFGLKTFLIYVEPVLNKAGETIGINYMGMEVTDQVKKREKMIRIREEIAVQKAKETELNKTIHITEETMRAKQMLATMSHEIRSPLSGVVSMAEILATSKLDREQRQLLDVMLSSGDLVLQLINDILDLSKVESGVMKLETTKFRPREVVKHVLQTAAASLQKSLTLEGHVADDVPIEVTGDVLRIRQILTNLISNAIKFTHEGKVGINLYVTPDPSSGNREGCHQNLSENLSTVPAEESKHFSKHGNSKVDSHGHNCDESLHQNHSVHDDPGIRSKRASKHEDEEQLHQTETTVWIRCDVYDTGIGIPENALPTLFKKYMQVSADHARKYGGTGLGLAICKQLVELMGGTLTVSSRVHFGSTFTFVLPYKVSSTWDHSDDPDDLLDMADRDSVADDTSHCGYFQFQPHTLGSLFSSKGSRSEKLSSHDNGCATIHKLNGFSEDSYSYPSNSMRSKKMTSLEDPCSLSDVAETLSEPESFLSHSPETDSENTLSKVKQCSPYHSLAISEASVMDRTCQRKEKSDMGYQCVSRSSTEASCSALRPRILLVDDNKTNVMVAQKMMKQFGHEVDVANNGVEAVRAVQRNRYDLILMDVCMPVMDGLEATRIIRCFEETGSWDAAAKAGIDQSLPPPDGQGPVHCTNRVPIVALTANALAESAEECFSNGMDSFVSKPISFQKLKDCLEQHLP